MFATVYDDKDSGYSVEVKLLRYPLVLSMSNRVLVRDTAKTLQVLEDSYLGVSEENPNIPDDWHFRHITKKDMTKNENEVQKVFGCATDPEEIDRLLEEAQVEGDNMGYKRCLEVIRRLHEGTTSEEKVCEAMDIDSQQLKDTKEVMDYVKVPLKKGAK